MKRFLSALFLMSAVLFAASAQRKPQVPLQKSLVDTKAAYSTRVYTYVEHMPHLPGSDGMGGIVAAIIGKLRLSSSNPDAYAAYTRPTLSFVVGQDGHVTDAKVSASSQVPSLDQAMLDAVNTLPRFVPGYQDGKPVVVQLNTTISCIKFR